MNIDWLNQNGFFDIAVKNFAEKTYANGNLAPASAHTSKKFFFLTVTPFLEVTVPANDLTSLYYSVS